MRLDLTVWFDLNVETLIWKFDGLNVVQERRIRLSCLLSIVNIIRMVLFRIQCCSFAMSHYLYHSLFCGSRSVEIFDKSILISVQAATEASWLHNYNKFNKIQGLVDLKLNNKTGWFQSDLDEYRGVKHYHKIHFSTGSLLENA